MLTKTNETLLLWSRVGFIFLIWCSYCHASSPSDQQAPIPGISATAAPDEIIVPGNVLDLLVAEDGSFNGRYQVRRGGYIIIPAVGRIPVAGNTVGGAEAEVRKALEATRLKRATVTLKKVAGSDVGPIPDSFRFREFKGSDPIVVFVTGRVVHPCSLPIKAGEKLGALAAITGAGGLARFADSKNIYVLRALPGGTKAKIPVHNPAIEPGASDIPLAAGDIVVVPEKFFSF